MTSDHDAGVHKGPLLIYQNPRSGDKDLREVRQIIESRILLAGRKVSFVQHDAGASLEQTFSAAFELASRCRGTVVVSGGDGTINVAASIAVERGQALGIIPGGTFNFVARSHGIPEGTAQAVDLLLSEKPRATRVGKVNDRLFLVNSSIGSYARLQQEREGFKKTIGRSRTVASIAAFVSALRFSPSMRLNLNYRGDEQMVDCSSLILCNSRLQLELIGVDTLPDDAATELACIYLSPINIIRQLVMIWKGWQRQISEADEVESFLFDEMIIKVANRRYRTLNAAVDGEMHRLFLPLRVRVCEKPLWLIRPPITGEVTTT